MEVKSIAIKPDLENKENKVKSPTNKHLILRLTVASCCYYKAGKEEKGVCGGGKGWPGAGSGLTKQKKVAYFCYSFLFSIFYFYLFFS